VNALQKFSAAIGTGVERIRSGTMRFTTRAGAGWSILLGRTNINYRSAVGDAGTNSIVVSVVGWLARNFPEAPVRLRRLQPDGTAQVIPPAQDGPGFMLRLLERPNAYFSGVLQWMATIVDLYIDGNAYWLKVRNEAGRVTELWWVPSRMMKPTWPDDGSEFISGYSYTVDGVAYAIDKRNVVHFRDGLDETNPRLGKSRLRSLFREIYTDDEAANFSAVLLTNLGVPGVVLAPSNTGGNVKTDPETIKTAYMEKFGGDRRGEPLVLTSPTDIKVLSWSPEQMNLKELRRLPEERITAVFGISAIVAGLGAGLDRSTFTNFGEARLAAYQESIVPLQRLLAAELEIQLLTDFADIERDALDVDFDISKASAMQVALDALWKRMESAATKGLITRATFKQAAGLPITAGDDFYIIASNYLILPAGEPQPPAPRQAGGSFPPAGTPQLEQGPTSAGLLMSGEVRCQGCDRLLAEQATPPYRMTCRHCKAVTTAELEPELEAA
jgi:HK97 family phage portal protein